MNQETVNILFNFLPEITLSLAVIILNVLSSANISSGKQLTEKIAYYVFSGGVIAAAISSYAQAYFAPQHLFSGAFSADHFSYGARVILTTSMVVIALVFYRGKSNKGDLNLASVSFIGALLSVSASNIFVLFVSMQVMVIPLLLIFRYELKSAIKYYIFNGVFAAIMLYGATLIYGVSGSGDYSAIAKFISGNPFNIQIFLVGFIMVLAGIFYNALLAPLNLNFAAFSNSVKKEHLLQFILINLLASLFAAARFIFTILHDSGTFQTGSEGLIFIQGINWQLMLVIIAAFSILAGNFIILWQYDLKKIVTFISISSAGYLLLGLISASHEGIAAFIFNAVLFALNTLGLTICLKLFKEKYEITQKDDLKGKGRSDKFLFSAFIFFLLSSAGFPLTGGFTGKLMLYFTLTNTPYLWLTSVGVLSSAVFLFVIYRFIALIFRGEVPENKQNTETISLIILLILLFTAILQGFYLSPLLNWAKYCSNLLGI
ncbi:MAG: hypothetical protein IAE93_13525 [Ignavibacteria bacterium]|nr:hypothetical protein [Ignavibacteria bacterium]